MAWAVPPGAATVATAAHAATSNVASTTELARRDPLVRVSPKPCGSIGVLPLMRSSVVPPEWRGNSYCSAKWPMKELVVGAVGPWELEPHRLAAGAFVDAPCRGQCLHQAEAAPGGVLGGGLA